MNSATATHLAASLVLLALSIAPAVAQDCLEYGDYLHWHGQAPGDGHLDEGALLGDYLIMIDTNTGLLVYDVTDRLAPARIADLPLSGDGSSIATADQPFAAGRHTLTWDGRDRAGRATASGVYLVRLVSGSVVESRKLVLLR